MSPFYLQLSASGVKSYKDCGPRRRNSRKRGSNLGHNSVISMSGEPLSKNEISRIRRSQVMIWSVLSLIWSTVFSF